MEELDEQNKQLLNEQRDMLYALCDFFDLECEQLPDDDSVRECLRHIALDEGRARDVSKIFWSGFLAENYIIHSDCCRDFVLTICMHKRSSGKTTKKNVYTLQDLMPDDSLGSQPEAAIIYAKIGYDGNLVGYDLEPREHEAIAMHYLSKLVAMPATVPGRYAVMMEHVKSWYPDIDKRRFLDGPKMDKPDGDRYGRVAISQRADGYLELGLYALMKYSERKSERGQHSLMSFAMREDMLHMLYVISPHYFQEMFGASSSEIKLALDKIYIEDFLFAMSEGLFRHSGRTTIREMSLIDTGYSDEEWDRITNEIRWCMHIMRYVYDNKKHNDAMQEIMEEGYTLDRYIEALSALAGKLCTKSILAAMCDGVPLSDLLA